MAINPGALAALKKLSSSRARQVSLPIIRARAIVSQLTVRDDLSLRTMFVSPDNYEKMLNEVLYAHTEFIDMLLPNNEVYKFETRPSLDQFLSMISDFDKKSLVYGLYFATYYTFNKQKITCPSCSDSWEELVTADQIVTPDTFAFWDEDKPFNEYVYPIDIEIKDSDTVKFRFNIMVPSAKDYSNVMRLLGSAKMKENFDKFGAITGSSEDLTLITKSIEIISNIETTEEDGTITSKEVVDKVEGLLNVYQAINDYIGLDVIETVSKEYENKFGKYRPKFKKPLECGKCGNGFDFPIDIEMALLKSFAKIT